MGAHVGARPLVLADPRNPGGQVFFAGDTDPAPLSVAGSTFVTPPFLGALISHSTPEVSGSLAIDGELTAPPNRLFCIFSPSGRMLPFHFTADVRIPGLEFLPASGPDYEVVRGGRDTHSDADSTWATHQTIVTLLEIAKVYRALSGSKLSVNDLSLRAGGLFDVENNWMPDHQDHRTGTDADVNRVNISGSLVNCLDDDSFLQAIVKVAASGSFPKRLCESGGRKHINFD